MIIRKKARSTLTAVELDVEDALEFSLSNGEKRTIEVVDTKVVLHSTTLQDSDARPLRPTRGARTVVRMHCFLKIDGHPVEMVRWVGNDRSFYHPWELFGLRLWLDTVDGLFDILTESHGTCRPRRAVRIAVQEATRRICPPLLHPWTRLPQEGLGIDDAYDGTNCWVGPYFGAEAHGGLDVNHQAGSPIWAPFNLDSQGLFDRVTDGASNNRWRGIRKWSDGSTWIIQAHHLICVFPEEKSPVEAGTLLALGGGVAVGSYEHTHFTFGIVEPGSSRDEIIRLDPWILFRQMYQDRSETFGSIKGPQAPEL